MNRHPWFPLLLATFLLAVPGCKESKKSPAAGETNAAPAKSYTVRGRLVSVAKDGREISVFHESIPDFVDRRGQVVGMMSMSMPFAVSEGLDLSAHKAGDKITFTFDVDFERKGSPTMVTNVEPLAADTALELADGSGKPSADQAGGGDAGSADEDDSGTEDGADHSGHGDH